MVSADPCCSSNLCYIKHYVINTTHANVALQVVKISARMAQSCSGLLVSVSHIKFLRFVRSLLLTPTVPPPPAGLPWSGSFNLRSTSNGSAHG